MATTGASNIAIAVRPAPTRILIQNRVELCSSVISARWIAAAESQKCLRLKPALGALGLECVCEVTNFLLTHFVPDWHEQVRLSQVTIILRNFILQNEMVSKCVPGQFRNQAMVLVGIVAVVSKNQIRGNRL